MKTNDIVKLFGEDLYDFLVSSYIEEGLSTPDIAKLLQEHFCEFVSAGNVWMLLKKFDIPIRSMSDSISAAKLYLDSNKTYLNKRNLPVIDGLLISDGSLNKTGRHYRFSISTSQEEFAFLCYNNIKDLCIDEPKFTKYKNINNGRKGTWSITTGIHPDFSYQYERWYKNGIKIIPDDFSLSPESLLFWYYGDGTIINSKSGNSCVLRLSTDSFSAKDIDTLVERMKLINIFSVRTSDNRIRLNTDSIPEFIRYIKPNKKLACYSYKFDIAEWRFWTPMKKAAQILNIPYNRLSHLVSMGAIDYNRSEGGKKVLFTDEQIEKLKALNESGMLTADARIHNYAITKNKFNTIPKDICKLLKEVRDKGFPYFSLNDERIVSAFNNLKNVPMIPIYDRNLSANYRNNELCYHFHRHLYETECDGGMSPVNAFYDDVVMTEIVENILIKNKDICSDKIILNEICNHKKVKRTSVFPVRVAKTLIAKFGKDKMKILDPCAGYSSRLIGFLTNGYEGTYIGIDPCKKTIEGLKRTYDTLGTSSKNHNCELINDCAETAMNSINDNFDIIFTSPPYFNLEKYDINQSQSYLKYPEYEMWLNDFLFKIIDESYRLLNKDGVFILNVGNARSNKIIDDVDKYVNNVFRVEDTILMHSPSQWHESITEPIFVLRKN